MSIITKNTSRPNSPIISLTLAAFIIFGGITSESLLAAESSESKFYLHAGDKVCFYGDSITQQRFYGADVETFVCTRFPDLHVKFVNSGVGGDKVTGGWAGGIDLRLKRDVFPFMPNVVTIMLGMNDAKYRPFDQKIYDTYTNGYEHIIQSLQAHLPGVRIVLIEPTPFDDVTEAPQFPGGYNAVLQRYAAFVRQLAAEHHLMCVDFMTPLLDVIQKAQAQAPQLAQLVIPGRVHPSPVGELVMAQALLQAWNAPAIVSVVTIDAQKVSVVKSENTTVVDLSNKGGQMSWSQNDASLPVPILGLHEDWPQFPPTQNDKWNQPTFVWTIPQPNWNQTNAAAEMMLNFSGFYQSLSREPLQVIGLPTGQYQLKINGQTVGEFSDSQLSVGINLAAIRTPMLEQAYQIQSLVWKQIQWHFFAWFGIQIRMMEDQDPRVQQSANALAADLEAQKDHDVEQLYLVAQPRTSHYELMRLIH
jgi:lysophospholipase L1-like esterase